ncbi:MAG: hypothetical protein COB61_011760 [Thiotrichales bacterium]|nr:hypothetical protein [Thiotrichales bacterium]
MALTKQQKWDMIRDVELRLAKEELAEQYVKNMKAIENSDKPLRTLKDIVQKDAPPVTEIDIPEKDNALAGQALHDYQTGEWFDLNRRHFEEFESLDPNADLEDFENKAQEEWGRLEAKHKQEWNTLENSDTPLEAEQAVLYSYENTPDPEIMARLRQKMSHLTSAEKELMEQSEIAVKTPSEKPGLDSKTQWQFIGFESLVRENAGKRDLNIQKDFENAQAMSNDHGTSMER